MGCYAVAAMLEEPPSVACRHLVESSAHRLYERLAGTRPGPPQERLELGKRFFYGVEIGRVGWQVEKRAASLLDELAHPRTFVRGCPSPLSAPASVREQGPAPHRPRRRPSWLHPPPPETARSPRGSCSPRA